MLILCVKLSRPGMLLVWTFRVFLLDVLLKAQVQPFGHILVITKFLYLSWGTSAHIVFLIFCFLTNIIVTAMLLLGGSAVVNALTGVNLYAASFLIPLGVIVYTLAGGLKATFLASYIHSVIGFYLIFYHFFHQQYLHFVIFMCSTVKIFVFTFQCTLFW